MLGYSGFSFAGTLHKCVIDHESFKPVCLLPDVLRTALVELHQVRSDRLEDPPQNASVFTNVY